MKTLSFKWSIACLQTALLAAAGSAFAEAGKLYVADEGANTVSTRRLRPMLKPTLPQGRR